MSAVHRGSLDGRLAFQLQAKVDEEGDRGREVVDDDADVVHPFDQVVLLCPVGCVCPWTDGGAFDRRQVCCASAARRLHVQIVLALGRIEVLHGIAQRRAGHRRRELIEVLAQSIDVLLAGFADPAADRLLHQLVRVVRQDRADPEGVLEVVLPDEEVGGHDRRPPLHRPGRPRQLVQRLSRPIPEVAADDIRRSAIDEAPVVDVLVVVHVELVQLEPPIRGGLLGPGLEVHDADGAQADLEDGVVQELRISAGSIGVIRLGQREQVAPCACPSPRRWTSWQRLQQSSPRSYPLQTQTRRAE